MSDLFHEQVPTEFILRVFDVIRRAEQHQFQVLTKRSERLVDVCSGIRLPANAWLGVSVETQDYTSRINDLRKVRAAVRFLSIEPLLGPIENLRLSGIDWVIVGGESGHHARPMDPAWVRSIRDQCANAGVPFFFKQWGGTRKHLTGRVLDGQTWDEMPLAFAG
jgi:protein gp37